MDDLSEFVLTKTTTEKLQEIFFKKCGFIATAGGRAGVQFWIDYLNKLEGVEYIYQFSNFADATDYLFESINENSSRRIVIKDKGVREYYKNRDAFILIEPEVAMKILALGMLP